MFIYLNERGEIDGRTVIPADTDIERHKVGFDLQPFDQFGQSVAPYQDIDKNGIREIVVGAPGSDYHNSARNISLRNTGAIYLLYPRRRRYHPIPFDWWAFYLMITIPLFCCFASCTSGTTYFCWHFRRQPDEIEMIVKKSGLAIDPKKPRTKYKRQDNAVYCDGYTV